MELFILQMVEAATCPKWRNGFLLADGTKFPLFQKPGLHGEAWFNKNKNYSIDCQVCNQSSQLQHTNLYSSHTLQIICQPHNLLITDYSLGHTGSVHDAWAFRSTRMFKNHEKIFGPGEWMWADSAYPPETWSISLFKKPVNGQLTADHKTFNYWVLKVSRTQPSTFNKSHVLWLQVCIRVKHTMGLLKGTFQSLKEIQIQLIDVRRHMIIIMWAHVCIVLHNLIIRIEGDNFDEVWRDGLVQTGLDHERADDDNDDDNEHGNELEHAH
jgi:DDE superfamily endonuclease